MPYAAMNKLRANPETKNTGKRWSEEEDAQLIKEVQEGLSYEEIAKIHFRTESAMKSRIYGKAIADYENGVDLETIYDRYKMSEAQFQEAFEKKMDEVKGEKKREKKVEKSKEEKIEEKSEEKVEEKIKEEENDKMDEMMSIFRELLSEVREMKALFKEVIQIQKE